MSCNFLLNLTVRRISISGYIFSAIWLDQTKPKQKQGCGGIGTNQIATRKFLRSGYIEVQNININTSSQNALQAPSPVKELLLNRPRSQLTEQEKEEVLFPTPPPPLYPSSRSKAKSISFQVRCGIFCARKRNGARTPQNLFSEHKELQTNSFIFFSCCSCYCFTAIITECSYLLFYITCTGTIRISINEVGQFFLSIWDLQDLFSKSVDTTFGKKTLNIN